MLNSYISTQTTFNDNSYKSTIVQLRIWKKDGTQEVFHFANRSQANQQATFYRERPDVKNVMVAS